MLEHVERPVVGALLHALAARRTTRGGEETCVYVVQCRVVVLEGREEVVQVEVDLFGEVGEADVGCCCCCCCCCAGLLRCERAYETVELFESEGSVRGEQDREDGGGEAVVGEARFELEVEVPLTKW
jgi:hypothetical protein